MRLDTRTGEEEVMCYTGAVSTRPAMAGGARVVDRISPFETLRTAGQFAVVLHGPRRRVRPGWSSDAATRSIPRRSEDAVAWVEYNPDGRYTVVVQGKEGAEKRFATPDRSEIHGLAWDDATRGYYVIVTDDSGMWFGRIDGDGVHPVTEGAYITLSNLRAGGGRLYFGSIASGRDEAHCFDLKTRREYRITTSALRIVHARCRGATARGGERVLLTAYDRRGYHVAAQRVADADALIPVAPSKLPLNVVNPEPQALGRREPRYGAVHRQSIRCVRSGVYRAKRYRKVPNLVNVHSWTPVAFNPFEAVDEHNINLNLGVTLLSQNLLSNTEAYRFVRLEPQRRGDFQSRACAISGWACRLDLDASYGGNQVFYSLVTYDEQTGRSAVTSSVPAPTSTTP